MTETIGEAALRLHRDDQLEALSNQLRAIQAQRAQLAEAESDLMAHVRDLVGDNVGDIKAHGKTVFVVTYPRRFDPALAEDLLATNPALLASITETPEPKPVISTKLAKAILPPAIYELCQKRSDDPSIKPKVAG
jgi:hypothetical protein